MSEQAVFEALKYRIVVNEEGTCLYYNAANQLHRIDGPAIVWRNGVRFWYINGKRLTKAAFNQAVATRAVVSHDM